MEQEFEELAGDEELQEQGVAARLRLLRQHRHMPSIIMGVLLGLIHSWANGMR